MNHHLLLLLKIPHLVYIIGTVFVSALCFKGKLDKPTWNALFWVITLFTSVTISGKSFFKETGGQALFNFLHYTPQQFIISKIIYNMLFIIWNRNSPRKRCTTYR